MLTLAFSYTICIRLRSMLWTYIFDDVDDKLFAFESLYLDSYKWTRSPKAIPCERQSSAFHDGTMVQSHLT